MNSCKVFAKKYPILIAALTTVLVFVLLRVGALIPEGPLSNGIREVFLAVVVFIWTFLFMGKEKVSLNFNGFGYAFKFFRAYFIFLTLLCVLMTALYLVSGVSSKMALNVLNGFIVGATVGIVEEFSFRGLVFGGILQKIGNSKKNIIIAAVLSGLVFGVMHIINSAIDGEVSNWGTVLTAVLKTCQTGIFGIIMAFVYMKTRNLFAVAAVHSLNDFILFLITSGAPESAGKPHSYVSGDIKVKVFAYVLFTLIMVPMLVRGIRNIDENEAVPFDDDFKPRAVEYKKTNKKKA